MLTQCWLLFPKFCESLLLEGERREKMIQRGETLKQKLEANSTRTSIERFTEKQNAHESTKLGNAA